MSSRVFMFLALAAFAAVAVYATLSGGGQPVRTVQSAQAAAETELKVEAAPAPVAAAAPSPAVQDSATSLTAAEAGPADISAFVGKKFRIGAPNLKKVALTFDDGPFPETTPQVLEILKREGIRATFFMLGQSVRKYPEMARTVAGAGHVIGSHTDMHVRLTGKSAEEIRHEVADTAKYVEKVTGKQARLFRPPYGLYNANVLKTCADNGMVMVTWSVDPDDWRKGSTAQTIYDIVMKQLTNGAVILLHDTHEKTVQALPLLIKELRRRGYQFVTVDELIAETALQPAAVLAGVAEAATPPPPPVSIPLSKSGM